MADEERNAEPPPIIRQNDNNENDRNDGNDDDDDDDDDVLGNLSIDSGLDILIEDQEWPWFVEQQDLEREGVLLQELGGPENNLNIQMAVQFGGVAAPVPHIPYLVPQNEDMAIAAPVPVIPHLVPQNEDMEIEVPAPDIPHPSSENEEIEMSNQQNEILDEQLEGEIDDDRMETGSDRSSNSTMSGSSGPQENEREAEADTSDEDESPPHPEHRYHPYRQQDRPHHRNGPEGVDEVELNEQHEARHRYLAMEDNAMWHGVLDGIVVVDDTSSSDSGLGSDNDEIDEDDY